MIYNQMENDDIFTTFWASNELQELSEMRCAGKIDTDVLRQKVSKVEGVLCKIKDTINKVEKENGK